MKTKRKALLLTLCAVLLVAASVFGTIAYLTDTDSVKNTFTVGKVYLNLDEADVKTDGSYETNHDSRVKENTYHLLPGHTYYKDPTVTVLAGSEDAYVRMMVEVKNIDQLKLALPGAEYYADNVFLLQKLCGGWDADTWVFEGYTESADGKTGTYEFRYKEVVKKNADENEATVLDDLFETITVPGEIDNTHLAYLAEVEINVTAHAIQADGFADADAAWNAFN